VDQRSPEGRPDDARLHARGGAKRAERASRRAPGRGHPAAQALGARQSENPLESREANAPIACGVRAGILFGRQAEPNSGPDPDVVVEKWESVDALKAHAAAPHMAAYGAKTQDLLASRVIHILSPA